MLVYVLLDAFSNPAKERTKVDGTSVSLWLKSESQTSFGSKRTGRC